MADTRDRVPKTATSMVLDVAKSERAVEVLDRLDAIDWVTKRFSGTLERTKQICGTTNVSHPSGLCLLLDNDVVRTFSKPDEADPKNLFAIEYIVERGRTPFGIPAGCFAELLDDLSPQRRVGRQVEKITLSKYRGEQWSIQDIVLEIARSLGIMGNLRERSLDEIQRLLLDQFGQRVEQLKRILVLVTHPRFVGVVSSYSRNDARSWLKLLSQRPSRKHRQERKHSVERAYQRDGINLAVTCRPILESKAFLESNNPSMVLVTQTESLLTLMDFVRIEPKTITLSKQLFGRDIVSEIDPFPVYSPLDAAMLELMGGAASAKAREETTIRVNAYTRFLEEIRNQLEAQSSESKMARPGLGPISDARRSQIHSLARRLIGALNVAGGTDRFVDFQQFQAIQNSIDVMLSDSGAGGHSELQSMAVQYCRTMANLANRIDQEKSHRYCIKKERPKLGQPFSEYRLKYSFDPHTTLLIAYRFTEPLPNGTIGNCKWFTVSSDIDIISAVQSILPKHGIDFQKSRKSEERLRPISREEQEDFPIVAFTEKGTFGRQPNWSGFRWRQLEHRQLIAAIESLYNFGPRDVAPKQIWSICLRFETFTMEIDYMSAPSQNRSIRVYHRYGASNVVADLLEATSFRYVSAKKCANELDKLF